MEAEKAWDLRIRTKRFAIDALRLSKSFKVSVQAQVVLKQFVRSATSTGANYRAARLARSKAEFVSKLQIALEEADESAYWLELAIETQLIDDPAAESVLREARELSAIMMTALKTARNV